MENQSHIKKIKFIKSVIWQKYTFSTLPFDRKSVLSPEPVIAQQRVIALIKGLQTQIWDV